MDTGDTVIQETNLWHYGYYHLINFKLNSDSQKQSQDHFCFGPKESLEKLGV